jgi:hypothetical protein
MNPSFSDDEDERAYSAWLESLPFCRTCEGTTYITDDWGHEMTCGDCSGCGREVPPQEEDDREAIQEGDHGYYQLPRDPPP